MDVVDVDYVDVDAAVAVGAVGVAVREAADEFFGSLHDVKYFFGMQGERYIDAQSEIQKPVGR